MYLVDTNVWLERLLDQAVLQKLADFWIGFPRISC